MKNMVVVAEYRHMPMRALSLLAQRTGAVFASVSTWAKQAKMRGWLRRPWLRVVYITDVIGKSFEKVDPNLPVSVWARRYHVPKFWWPAILRTPPPNPARLVHW